MGELLSPGENAGSSDSSWTHFPLEHLWGEDGAGLHAPPSSSLWRGSWAQGTVWGRDKP